LLLETLEGNFAADRRALPIRKPFFGGTGLEGAMEEREGERMEGIVIFTRFEAVFGDAPID
jgi:hypothetical protein